MSIVGEYDHDQFAPWSSGPSNKFGTYLDIVESGKFPTFTEWMVTGIGIWVFPGRKFSYGKGLLKAAWKTSDDALKYISTRPVRSYLFGGGTAGAVVLTTPAGLIASEATKFVLWEAATRGDRWYDTLFRDQGPLSQAVVLPAGPQARPLLQGLSSLRHMSVGGQPTYVTLGGTSGNEVSRRARRKGRRRRGISSRPPYCRVHSKSHWCWNTRKR